MSIETKKEEEKERGAKRRRRFQREGSIDAKEIVRVMVILILGVKRSWRLEEWRGRR